MRTNATVHAHRRAGIGGRIALVVFVTVGLVLGGAVAPAAGSTTGTATISGTVTGSGAPLPGVTVQALGAFTGRVLQTGVTASDGTYRLTAVPAGAVKVRFAKSGWLTSFAVGRASFWSADAFGLWPGRVLGLPRQQLIAEAVVQGQVLSWMDPLGGATVSVLDANTGRVLKSVRLAEYQYEYRIGGLAAGPVKVRATKPGYLQAYADGAHTFAAARVFDLHAGQVLQQEWLPTENRLYLDLTPGGYLRGSVLGLSDDPVYGWDDPLAGVTVQAIDAATGRLLESMTTDALGNYDLQVGWFQPIKVRFSKPGWVTSYAPNATSWATAGTYVVQPTDWNVLGTQDLYSRPAIQGQVLSWMDPLGYARVTVYDAVTGCRLGSTVADGAGYYRIAGLPVRAVKVGATKAGYVPGFANNRPSLATADVFVLQAGHTLQQQWDPMVLYLDLAPVP